MVMDFIGIDNLTVRPYNKLLRYVIVKSMSNLITAGEFAKLASTTKRTIHFYGEKGILKPSKITDNLYRLYQERQILDYQMILLLSNFGVPLNEMKRYVMKQGNLTELFEVKKERIQQNIDELQFNLRSIEKFQKNIKDNGTMINPQVKILKPFDVYYIEKIGPYAKIGEYCSELTKMIHGKNIITLAIFEEEGYRPKKSNIKIGILAKDLVVKDKFKNIVQKFIFKPGKVLSYTHNGSGAMLSLFWKELEKYAELHSIKTRKNFPDFEIYRKVDKDITKQFFEIYLPIR